MAGNAGISNQNNNGKSAHHCEISGNMDNIITIPCPGSRFSTSHPWHVPIPIQEEAAAIRTIIESISDLERFAVWTLLMDFESYCKQCDQQLISQGKSPTDEPQSFFEFIDLAQPAAPDWKLRHPGVLNKLEIFQSKFRLSRRTVCAEQISMQNSRSI